MTTLDELEALLQLATPRPWASDCDRYEVVGCVNGPDGQEVFGDGWSHPGLDGAVAQKCDADLAAAAVNALPALIAAARAGQKVASRVAWPDGLVQGYPPAPACIVMRKDHDDLRQAIAALEEP